MYRGRIRTGLAIAAALAALGLGTVSSFGQETETETVSRPQRSYEHLNVAGTTPLTGSFFTDQFGNGAADLDVRSLIHGYNLIRWNAEEGMFETDPSVVSGTVVTKNEQGDVSFKLSLYQNLKFSDGSDITARDYAFTVMLGMLPSMKEIGAQIGKYSYIQGADAFMEGTGNVFSGLRITSDHELTITVDHSQLPFFYELGLLDIVPYPIGEIAPGYRVQDDGNGVFFANESTGAKESPSAQLLRDTLLDENDGYIAHPSVTSGPYTLTSFSEGKAEFAVNPMYKGNHEGIRPSIETISFTDASNENMISLLADGKVDLLNRVSDQEAVQDGILLTSGDESISMSSYPRSGLSFISFCAGHNEALSDKAVRQAIAWCLDRTGLTAEYEGNYGVPVSGFFGIGQWMYGLERDFINALPSYEAESEEAVSQAAALLDADGWTLNESGDAFVPGTDAVRCREAEDGSMQKLSFTLACPQNSRIGAILETSLRENLEKAGIQLSIKPVSGDRILSMYRSEEEQTCDLLYLATNFNVVFDACDLFSDNEAGQKVWGSTGIVEDEMYTMANAMRHTDPGDLEGYRTRWEEFQSRFAEELPAIPVYSNAYFDFYTSLLQQYDPSLSTSWAQAVSGSYLSDPPASEDALTVLDETESGDVIETESDDVIEIDD